MLRCVKHVFVQRTKTSSLLGTHRGLELLELASEGVEVVLGGVAVVVGGVALGGWCGAVVIAVDGGVVLLAKARRLG